MFGKKEEYIMTPVYALYNQMMELMFFCKCLFDYEFKNKIVNNKNNYESKYCGKRCFILGNGPSLKDYDLSLLKNQYVFSVNHFMKSMLFDVVRPNFHVMIDPTLFRDEIIVDYLSDYKKTMSPSANIDIVYFIPYYGVENFVKYFQGVKYVALYEKKVFTMSSAKNISLYGSVPCYSNVILMCIHIAISMGFKEIVMLGVDMTGFIGTMQTNCGQEDKYGHVYDKCYNKRKKINTNEYYLKLYGRTFEQFRYFASNMSKYNIKIVNATAGGLLDVFPSVDYYQIVSS